MNKMDLIEHVAGEMEMSRAAANRAVDTIIEGITKALKKGEEVRITGFGTFTVKKRAAGKGRNPATGEAIKNSRVEECPLQGRRDAEGGRQQGPLRPTEETSPGGIGGRVMVLK